MSTIVSHSLSNISETVRDGGLVPNGPPIGNDLWGIRGSRDHDVTWPQKVKLVTPVRLQCNISKTAGNAI